ncbi:MAG: hypothetical protein KJ583_06770 [Nanoarchaeota archaeon]|nr:hypothetical protein [Nanoarchaeota archaeon]MBU1270083.1 hypothetical protein [Nanoarchaeota archaeon]MBU1604988.1 hypothetical protein [Nanoarchaeota archaeon]MBU2443419.1 hypothetical protein [Nanoarchaeota archaeon]
MSRKNKLMNLFIGNVSNAATHIILEQAIEDENIRKHYDKESLTSLNIAKRYREKINPKNKAIPDKDLLDVKNRIKRKVGAELNLRISKGYKNINLELVEPIINHLLKEVNMK